MAVSCLDAEHTSSFHPRRTTCHLVLSLPRSPPRPWRSRSGSRPQAGSAPPQERTAGTSGAKTYHRLAHAKKSDYVKLDLLALNDFHGNLEPPTGSSGNIPGITNAQAPRPVEPPTWPACSRRSGRSPAPPGATPLTVAAGDLIGASPLLSAAFHDEPTIKAMNLLGLDVSSVGNHEFDEGVNELLRMEKGGCLADGNGANGQDSCPAARPSRAPTSPTSAPMCSGRTRRAQPATPFKPYKIFKVDGQKVGFIGMTLEDTDTSSPRPGSPTSTSATRSRPPTRWCPS